MEPSPPRVTLRILIADDDADMRFYLRGCLRDFGSYESVRVHEAVDGREALHLAHALVPDLVISDVVMPGLSGTAFCHALKADPATVAITFLFISGEARPPEGGDGFLAKPFNAAQLRAEVKRLLRGPPPTR